MNIKEAKIQIKNAITAYFSKDEDGSFVIPPQKQRPVFLMGPPGIGKTAIMEQIAAELGIGLLSYSMTHHTRQSALGLPFIEKKLYDGKEYAVSEYTMSEIIASIYDMMEETDIREGILFLDEINCVSETLSPIMLQFLQYKIFGRHKVPKGWIVVTAGNPPEYNDSVKEFDMATWDRLKRIDVEADYDVWKEYAYKIPVHPAILTYLDIKKEHFYKAESSVDGKNFVTARGWDDLSQMIFLYEKHQIEVDYSLISQYLQNRQIAQDFSIYYDLFNKYRSDYQIDKILEGTWDEKLVERAKSAKFDERLSLLGLILESVAQVMKDFLQKEEVLEQDKEKLFKVKENLHSREEYLSKLWENMIKEEYRKLERKEKSNSMSRNEEKVLRRAIQNMEEKIPALKSMKDAKEGFAYLKDEFLDGQKKLQTEGLRLSQKLSSAFQYLETCFANENELVIFISELNLNPYTSLFVNKFPCEEYFKNNKKMLTYDRQQALNKEIESLDLE